jgi:hypothetical protein
MKKLLLLFALLFEAQPALAVDSATLVGNVAYTMLSTDFRITPTVALTANRTWTLVSASATCVGQTCPSTTLDIIDSQGNVGGANSCIVIAPQSGETINGSTSSVTFCATYGRAILFPMSGTNWFYQSVAPGQLLGTTTNDNATAGNIGEVITTGLCPGSAATATVTITIAAPGVVTWTAHGITGACPVVFTTSGALPTGITSGTTYYVVPGSVTANTFTIATTVANALAGTAITTSGSQSGTQTGTGGVSLSTGAAATVTGLALTAGDWDCRAVNSHVLGASTSVTVLEASISTAATTMAAQGLTSSNYHQDAATVMGALGQDLTIGPFRISMAATTNEFLVESDTFTVSTDVGFGSMTCRRAR